VSIVGPSDPGKPAVVDQTTDKVTIAVPKETEYRREEIAGTTTEPARVVESFKFFEPTTFERTASSLRADTGTVDTTVAVRRVESEEKRPLVYAAMACGVAALAAMYFGHPTIALCCAGAAGLAFAAWKLADVPSWLWVLALVAAAGLYFGYIKDRKTT